MQSHKIVQVLIPVMMLVGSPLATAASSADVTLTATFVYPTCNITASTSTVSLPGITVGTANTAYPPFTLTTTCSYAAQPSSVYAAVKSGGTVNGSNINMSQTTGGAPSNAQLSLHATGGASAEKTITYGGPGDTFCLFNPGTSTTRDCVITPYVNAASAIPGAVTTVMTFTVAYT